MSGKKPAYGGAAEAERLRRIGSDIQRSPIVNPDYSRSRHSHSDDVTCAAAGDKGHPDWMHKHTEECYDC